MKTKSILLLVAVSLTATSCSMFSATLSSVECPMDAKQMFGETKIVNIKDSKLDTNRYEDDFIDISWSLSHSRFDFNISHAQFHFKLKNKSNHTIKINWDDMSYVGTTGRVSRVDKGMKYISLPMTTIPKGAVLHESVSPTDDVSNFSGNWFEKNHFSANDSKRQTEKPTVSILMPILIENIQNDYLFVFEIDKNFNPEEDLEDENDFIY